MSHLIFAVFSFSNSSLLLVGSLGGGIIQPLISVQAQVFAHPVQ